MEEELTLGDIYEAIADRLATARTKALMGERQEALGVFQGAALEFTRFREVLSDYPGYHALEHAFHVTLGALCAEEEQTQHIRRSEIQEAANEAQAKRSRRRVKRAA